MGNAKKSASPRSLKRLVSPDWRREEVGWWYLLCGENKEVELMFEAGVWKVYYGPRGSSLKSCLGIWKTLKAAKLCGERANDKLSGRGEEAK